MGIREGEAPDFIIGLKGGCDQKRLRTTGLRVESNSFSTCICFVCF